ncbi:hypothetical protein LCGC14_1649500 [marine sediment metagenome]|uniref:LamG-like jellyroll fold domain-containing protein n=1 Tax=marine sediment metagenome TaxID=412755 RepID=A0A0F9HY53_9ZZZZ
MVMARSPALRFPRASYFPKYVPTADCVLYLPGQDDQQSAVIRDRSGKGNNGASTGSSWVKLPSGLWVISMAGSGEIEFGNDSSLDFTTALTVDMWINTTRVGDDLLHKYELAGDRAWAVWITATGKVSFNIDNSPVSVGADTAITDGIWHRLTFVYNSVDMRIYLDGVLDCTPAAHTAGISVEAATLQFGSNQLVGAFTGRLGFPFALFNIAKTAARIAWDHRAERHLFGV